VMFSALEVAAWPIPERVVWAIPIERLTGRGVGAVPAACDFGVV
jgi:hypothetical protein